MMRLAGTMRLPGMMRLPGTMRFAGMRFTALHFTGSLRAFALAAFGLGLGAASASAQTTTYTAPNGYFTVQVPAGWTTDWDNDLNQVTLRRGSAMSTVQVLPLPHETSALAAEMLETTKKELIGQCKGSDELQHGQAHLAGMPAQSFLLRCPNAPPSVAGTAIAWIEKNGQKILIQYTAIAQIRTYGDDVATLDAIGQSIQPTGLPAIAVHAHHRRRTRGPGEPRLPCRLLHPDRLRGAPGQCPRRNRHATLRGILTRTSLTRANVHGESHRRHALPRRRLGLLGRSSGRLAGNAQRQERHSRG